VNAKAKGGAEQREKYLFAYGEGRDVGGSHGEETLSGEAQVGCHFMEEGNQEIKVSFGRVRRGQTRRRVSCRASIQILERGYGRGLDWGREAQP